MWPPGGRTSGWRADAILAAADPAAVPAAGAAGTAGSTGWRGPGGEHHRDDERDDDGHDDLGVTCSPSLPSRSVASSTEVRGRSMAQHMAPIPMPIAGARLIPGSRSARCRARPPRTSPGTPGRPGRRSVTGRMPAACTARARPASLPIVGGVRHEGRQRVLTREEHVSETLTGDQLVGHRGEADEQAEHHGHWHPVTVDQWSK